MHKQRLPHRPHAAPKSVKQLSTAHQDVREFLVRVRAMTVLQYNTLMALLGVSTGDSALNDSRLSKIIVKDDFVLMDASATTNQSMTQAIWVFLDLYQYDRETREEVVEGVSMDIRHIFRTNYPCYLGFLMDETIHMITPIPRSPDGGKAVVDAIRMKVDQPDDLFYIFSTTEANEDKARQALEHAHEAGMNALAALVTNNPGGVPDIRYIRRAEEHAS